MKGSGKIHIYTGDGKGKSSAAAGLATRALGAGLKVLFIQFMKDGSSSEFNILSRQPDFTYKAAGLGRFLMKRDDAAAADFAVAKEGFDLACEAFKSGQFDLVVLDEILWAVTCGLLPVERVVQALKGRAPGVEVVMTGRNPAPELLETADLVTEMRCVKHYYQSGRRALKGIEF